MVDIVVNEKREQADMVSHQMDKGNKADLQVALQELGDEGDANPFWAKFLQPQPESTFQPIAGAIE